MGDTVNLCKYPICYLTFTRKFEHSLMFLAWIITITKTVAKWWFLFISFTFDSWLSIIRKSFSFSPFIYFICFCKSIWTLGYFIQQIKIYFYNYLFWRSNCPRLAQWLALQTGFYILLMCPYHILNASLLSDIKLPFIFILCFCCSSLEITHFFLGHLLLVENSFEKSKSAWQVYSLLWAIAQWTELW